MKIATQQQLEALKDLYVSLNPTQRQFLLNTFTSEQRAMFFVLLDADEKISSGMQGSVN